MEKIVLYYKFVPLADPHMAMLWQRELCERLGLLGRVIVSEHGINGTLGGDLKALLAYRRSMNKSVTFKGIDYKFTKGSAADFPRLSVKVRPELVTFGLDGEIEVDANGVVGGGKHLSPTAVNRLVEERGDEVVFFDGRNAYEAEIGRFHGAVVPRVDTTHDFISALEAPEVQALKDRPIITYCTGGIRCEVLSAEMIKRGFKEVYQIKGGVVRYVNEFGEDGLWDGSLYTFDKRMVVDFGAETTTLGQCDTCGAEQRIFRNCDEPSCKARFLRCENCLDTEPGCQHHATMGVAVNG